MTPNSFPWEGQEKLAPVYGFRLVGGNVTISLTYAVVGSAVMLVAATKIGDQETPIWRHFWSPKSSAVAAAEDLAASAEEYLFETLRLAPRPDEDLDFDDFVEHLRLRLAGEFH